MKEKEKREYLAPKMTEFEIKNEGCLLTASPAGYDIVGVFFTEEDDWEEEE